MNKYLATTLSLAAAACVAVSAAPATASAPKAAPTAADLQFLTKNAQVDLAEITLARIVLARTTDPAARELAVKTKADHQVALGRVRTIARHKGVTLPATPNAMQQQVAAALMTSTNVPLDYFTAQVAGHEMSISDTQAELASGGRRSVVAYAGWYLPYAQMHLQMAQADLQAIGG